MINNPTKVIFGHGRSEILGESKNAIILNNYVPKVIIEELKSLKKAVDVKFIKF